MHNNKPILIIGHKNPDTDSICSAIGYAYLKQEQGFNAIAARAGEINPETKFVLDYFQVPAPRLIEDLHLRISDIKLNHPPVVKSSDSLRDVGKLFVEQRLKAVPVVNDQGKILGLVTVTDLANRYFEELAMQDLKSAQVDYASVAHALDAQFCAGQELANTIVAGEVKIAAASTNTFISMVNPQDLIIIGDRFEAQLASLRAGVSCMVLTSGAMPDELIVQEAHKLGCVILSTPHGTYRTTRIINQSIAIDKIMQPNLICFKATDLLEDVKQKMLSTSYRSYPVLDNGIYVGLLDRGKFVIPERQDVILVDHNERSQAVEGIEEAHILEIVDHHRLGGLTTGDPLFIRLDTVGSTATIVANMIFHRAIDFTREIAGILMSAIISDTMYFRSPTSTDTDRETVCRLAKIAQVDDVEEFAMQVLQSGSVINSLSPAEVVRTDIKEFNFGEYRFAISQIGIMNEQDALKKAVELSTALNDLRLQRNYDCALLMATDILKEGTNLFFVGEQHLLDNIFGQSIDDLYYHLPGVMSRKKQVVPMLSEALR